MAAVGGKPAQRALEKVNGVVSVVAGYTGGTKANPTYEEVSSGGTGHRESVEITFDPAKVTYGQLLDIFWHNIDPLDDSGQFCDHGPQYRSAIFWHNEPQRKLAALSMQNVKRKFGSARTSGDGPVSRRCSPWPIR